ncbi:MAG: sulfatase-like hydrolase/transferase [Candidatus Latescibacteria bacterium]|jgi:arylsulfatase|nr:sulfatase-like hydrolase/transferase [Candidatus Latescibacterota bacterium]
MHPVRPNILWYCTDQQRFDTIGALGNPHVNTPILDGLVRGGTAFTHAYCQSPICTPSRSSFMTGMYPSRIHNCRNGNGSFPNHPPLISKMLADSGYDCGMAGKFHLQSSGRRTEPRLDDGYRYWRFSHAPRDDWAQGHDYADWVREQGGDLDDLRESEGRVPAELHQTTWITECAREFITQDREDPWFLTLNPYDPHPPFIPPQSYADRFDPDKMPGPHFRESDIDFQKRFSEIVFQTEAAHPDIFNGRNVQALYYAMIAQIDDQLGRILDCLEEAGQRENTIVVFTSDHGEALGDHGLLYKGCRFYEGLVRVPLIFHCPGRISAGIESEALVELIDMSATILEMAGVSAHDDQQGRSLMPILRGDAPPGDHREFVRSEYFDTLDAPEYSGKPPSYGTMYRDRRYKLVLYHGHDLGELYDLENDPWEFSDLWNDRAHQSVKHELIRSSFNASMLQSVDVGPPRIAPM